MLPRSSALLLAFAATVVATEAQSIGFGRVNAAAVLGQPLNLLVPLRLEAGEQVESSCASAEVIVGESRLARDHVRVTIEQAPAGESTGSVARIVTDRVIDEPVVEVVLNIGCGRSLSRRFVAFADPPDSSPAASTAPPRPVDVAQVPAVVPARGPLPPTATAGTASAPTPARQRVPTPPARRHAASPQSDRAPARHVAHAPAVKSNGGGPRLLLDAAPPRLKLDMEEPILSVAGASGAAPMDSPAESSSTQEADRLQLLEKAMSDLRRETQASRDATNALKLRLAEAEGRSRAIPWLGSLLVLALGVAAWLALRLRRLDESSDAKGRWWAQESPGGSDMEPAPEVPLSAPAPLAPRAGVSLDIDLEAPPPPQRVTAPTPSPVVAAPAVPQVEPYERTSVLTSPMHVTMVENAEPASAREVSVEELLDLEQQADFFIALGQEDAAVDLLMSHLRSTGGLSPLPYTKLLEIYRRKDDRDAYERIRARFNRRFNAYAPEWESGPMSGRWLEDYPEVVSQLESLWREPLNAMAVLEAMLFRKGNLHEFFDLPAYKDILLLYAIARDHWQVSGSSQPDIDVLLPLANENAESDAIPEAAVEPPAFAVAPGSLASDAPDAIPRRDGKAAGDVH